MCMNSANVIAKRCDDNIERHKRSLRQVETVLTICLHLTSRRIHKVKITRQKYKNAIYMKSRTHLNSVSAENEHMKI